MGKPSWFCHLSEKTHTSNKTNWHLPCTVVICYTRKYKIFSLIVNKQNIKYQIKLYEGLLDKNEIFQIYINVIMHLDQSSSWSCNESLWYLLSCYKLKSYIFDMILILLTLLYGLINHLLLILVQKEICHAPPQSL